MLVKDIYGDRENEYTSLGLSPTLIASSFEKAIHCDPRYVDLYKRITFRSNIRIILPHVW